MKEGIDMIKAIIFDLDGTLLDTAGDITNSINKTLEHFNYDLVTRKEVMSFLGNGSKELVRKSLKKEVSNDTLEEITKYYSNEYTSPKQNSLTKPYEGIMDLLRDLKGLNIKTAITSNKMQKGVTDLTDAIFTDLIDSAIGEGNGIPLKPNPIMIYEALEEIKVSKEEALFIGDTEVDLLAASNANIDSVAVTWGFRTKEYLSSLTAKYMIDEPSELIDIILELNSK